MKGIKVMKFGGTSVATHEARHASAMRVISAREQGYRPVVVVSAMGRRGDPYATDTLIQLLTTIDPDTRPELREQDLIMACGEILSAVTFAHLLKTLGQPAKAFLGGQAGIRTDGVPGNARILSINPANLIASLDQGKIPVVCGFQGTARDNEIPGGEITTLGRGGSDTTGAALGAALHAVAVEIFTDVDGIKTADPDSVKNAATLRKVSYNEVAEIAHLGAKVVHPRAAEIAMNNDIPLWVKNTMSDDVGTEIVRSDVLTDSRPTGVTHTGKLVYMQFDLSEASESHRTLLEGRLYEMLARYNISLFMLNLSPTSTGFAVPRGQYPVVQDLLDGLVVPMQRPAEPAANDVAVYFFQIGDASKEVETQAKLLEVLGKVGRVRADLTEACSMVSLVGHEFMRQPGLFFKVLKTLADAQIPVLQTSDSDFSLSVLVPESDTNRAVRLIHDRFDLANSH
ncbi:MAG: aspartate kinase [Fimbriimonas sp.]